MNQNLVKTLAILALYCDSLISSRSQLHVPRFMMQFFGDDSITEQYEAPHSKLRH